MDSQSGLFIIGVSSINPITGEMLIFSGPMIKLALPGLLMVEAEFLAFEILTLASSYFGTTHLAAQSILSTLTALTFQIPFPISIAASTRVANLIGATLTDAAKTSAKVVCTYSPGLTSSADKSGNVRRYYCWRLQRHPPLLPPKLHSPTLHQRPRRHRPCCLRASALRRLPTLRCLGCKLQWPSERTWKTGDRRLGELVLLLCCCNADFFWDGIRVGLGIVWAVEWCRTCFGIVSSSLLCCSSLEYVIGA
jgi:MatE